MSVMPEGAGLGGVLPRGAQSPVMRVAQAASALEAGSGSTAGGDAALEKACSEFESLFIYKMLSTMRATIPSSELLGGGRGRQGHVHLHDGSPPVPGTGRQGRYRAGGHAHGTVQKRTGTGGRFATQRGM